MAAVKKIETVVLLFPNEEWADTATDSQLSAVVSQLRPNISYALTLNDNLRTLSSHNTDHTTTIGGLLYVPDLDRHDPCSGLLESYIPANVTRQANLPPTDFTLVALAPWINVECTFAFLAAADKDPAKGFIFYIPHNGTSQPPPASSSIWDLGDAGKWKSQHSYPIYAVPSDIGEEMMHQSSFYSGNMTSVPHGHQISELPGIDPRDYVRMYTELHVTKPAVWPTYPVVLVVTIVVLLIMVGITSAVMHIILRSRRSSLERRVVDGEVNLEALGIKRLTVPREHINKLPLFTYNLEEGSIPPKTSRRLENNSTPIPSMTAAEGDRTRSNASSGLDFQHTSETVTPVSVIADAASNADSNLAHKYLPYSQPTCLICLEEFESGITPIRELPCGHIFHPACIDSFLSYNSSLCPICKKGVLPRGYCPTKITNAMVRRERNIRRLRSRVTLSEEEDSIGSDIERTRFRRYQATARRNLTHPTTTPRVYEEVEIPVVPQTTIMGEALPAENVSVPGRLVPEGPRTDNTMRDYSAVDSRNPGLPIARFGDN